MSRDIMYLLDVDVNNKFKSYLLTPNMDFVFNGSKKGLKTFLELRNSNEFVVQRKYQDSVVVKNTFNWYVDTDCLERINFKLGK